MKPRILPHAMAVLTLVLFTACFKRFYQTNSVAMPDATLLSKLVAGQRYFIIHSRDWQYALNNAKVVDNRLEGYADSIPGEHARYLNPPERSDNRIKARDRKWALNEVHVYTRDAVAYHTLVRLPLSSIYRLDAYGNDKEANSRATTSSVLGIAATVGGLILLGVIAAGSMSFSLGKW